MEGGRWLRVEVIYTRGHCHCTFRRKLHGFMVKYRGSEHSSTSPSPCLFSSCCLSFHLAFVPFFFSSLSQYPSVSCLLSGLPFFSFSLSPLALYHSASPARVVQFISVLLLRRPPDSPSPSRWPLSFSPPAGRGLCPRDLCLLRDPSVSQSLPSRDSLSRLLPFLFRKANKARVDGILCRVRS